MRIIKQPKLAVEPSTSVAVPAKTTSNRVTLCMPTVPRVLRDGGTAGYLTDVIDTYALQLLELHEAALRIVVINTATGDSAAMLVGSPPELALFRRAARRIRCSENQICYTEAIRVCFTAAPPHFW